MARVLHTRNMRIGNSQGLCIPKILIEQAGLGDEVEPRLEGTRLAISAAQHPRTGREGAFGAFREMAGHGDATLLDADSRTPGVWDSTEWQW